MNKNKSNTIIKKEDALDLNIEYLRKVKEIDITKKLQEALKINEQILFNIPVGIMIVDRKKKIKMMNKYAAKITGYSENELMGKQCNDFICTTMRNSCPVLDLHQKVDSSKKVIVNKSGEKVPVLKTVIPIQLDNEEVLLEAFVDMSEQIRTEEKLRKSEENYRAIFNNLHDIYFRTDIKGNVIMLSPSVEKITGYKIEEVMGKNASIFYKGSDNSKNVVNILIKNRYLEKIWIFYCILYSIFR